MAALNGQQVMVTGATGFLGGALARRLVAEGAQVRALVRSPGSADALRAAGVAVAAGDITQADDVRAATEGCAYVFHCAANFTDWQTQQAVNVEGTRHVAAAAAAARVTRLVHVSSVAVYGYERTTDTAEAAGTFAARHDPYNITKIAAERIVSETMTAAGVSYSIIRPGMIYGTGSGMWTERMFRVARLKPTPFIGDGRGSAYPIHVEDVVDLMIVLATHPAAEGQIFNCSPDPAPTMREWLGLYQRLAGHNEWLAVPPVLVLFGLRLLAAVSPAHSRMKDLPAMAQMAQRRVTYRMDKARTVLGWQPRVDLAAGVAGTAEWLRSVGLLRDKDRAR